MLSKADFNLVVSAQNGHRQHHTGSFETCSKGMCPHARGVRDASRVKRAAQA